MSYNPILDRWKNGKKTGAAYKRAPQQEKETAERIGGRKIRASGRGHRKADVELPEVVRIECKATESNSFRVTKEMVQKVENAGILENQFPVIDIEFVNSNGAVEYAACVMKRIDLFSLLERVREAEGHGKTTEGRSKLSPKLLKRK